MFRTITYSFGFTQNPPNTSEFQEKKNLIGHLTVNEICINSGCWRNRSVFSLLWYWAQMLSWISGILEVFDTLFAGLFYGHGEWCIIFHQQLLLFWFLWNEFYQYHMFCLFLIQNHDTIITETSLCSIILSKWTIFQIYLKILVFKFTIFIWPMFYWITIFSI